MSATARLRTPMDAAARPVVGTAELVALDEGRFAVKGALNAETASDLLERSESAFNGAPRIDLDLSGVVEADSAGLALVIEWLRLARRSRQPIHFKNLPAQIVALARISEVEELVLANGSEQTPHPR